MLQHQPPRRTPAALAAIALAVGTALTATALTHPAQAADLDDGDAILNMFEWNWDSIADECAGPLADSGYTHVQTSPPQEHILGTDTGPGEEHAWYIHYQPVSYKLDSRLGTRAEFADMVAACEAAGIGVIADAVINHMAAGADETRTGWAGSEYSRFHYPDAGYGPNDFHSTGDDYCEISDYGDRWEVQNCHLVGLNDLDTGSDYVQGRIADYLNDLMGLGVAGFRIDAAKHIDAGELGDIIARVNGDPYIVQEVIEADGEPVTDDEYAPNGDVHVFDYARDLEHHIGGSGDAQHLPDMGTDWGYTAEAGTFVANHDTERGGETLNQTHGRDYLIAEAFMLAHPFGTPSSYTGYEFDTFHEGPPLNTDGTVKDVDCGSGPFTCIHRSPYLSGMAGFRAATAGGGLTDVWGSGDAFAFGRGESGHAVFNASDGTVSRTFGTSLPDGDYTDVISGDTVTVSGGSFAATVPGGTALAIHVGATGGGDGGESGCIDVTVTAETDWGQMVHITGAPAELGSWDPSASPELSPDGYPQWTATVDAPAGRTVEYKYTKVDDAGDAVWESGSNRTVTVPASGCASVDDTWR
ncbi:carbohydrate-binding module family 20 domain-containing protein [Glycomyces xiaoerkulensis]|uniref:carbohydrate-binding module family 20 domain-containing protein n=1 Tax=Glycomyces xiaoerkulensis TaxID=2038139 RepID=UPI000C262F13|nr:carbohydrate-binding module family 20 domain-containing protein [Glycomyces xiaoerkulensis]